MTIDYNLGIQNIIESNGIGIAGTGMLIVFIALGLITFSIFMLPKALNLLEKVFPKTVGVQSIEGKPGEEPHEIIAAIGYVLHKASRR